MGRCVLLNFKLPWSISGLELRAVSTHPRFMFDLGLAQRHVWAVTGHSSHPDLGMNLPSALVNESELTDHHRNTGVNSRVGGRQWASSGLCSHQSWGNFRASHLYYGFRSPTKTLVASWNSQASWVYPTCLPHIAFIVWSALHRYTSKQQATLETHFKRHSLQKIQALIFCSSLIDTEFLSFVLVKFPQTH